MFSKKKIIFSVFISTVMQEALLVESFQKYYLGITALTG